MEAPKQRYLAAKRLVELWLQSPFMEWKNNLDKQEAIVLMRSESQTELNDYIRKLSEFKDWLEIVQQKSIGGKPVF
jgi:hypothetical protein